MRSCWIIALQESEPKNLLYDSKLRKNNLLVARKTSASLISYKELDWI